MSQKKNTDNRAEMIIRFDQVQATHEGLPVFRPLDQISGSVQIIPKRDLNKARDTTLELRWYTTGRGDTDAGVIESRVLHQGAISQSMTLSDSFRFTLPQEPWSFSGHYININWAIRVLIDLPMASDISLTENFLMLPGDGSSAGESAW